MMNDAFNILDYPAAFVQPLRLAPETAWGGHIPFGMALIEMARPNTIVELGTQAGASYCAFCQAVSALRVGTRCFAVDTWRGDDHTGSYGEEILASLRTHHDPLYGSFSTLLQTDFDSAAKEFTAGTIDILHIDGLHTYEAVKHDYETWVGKMSPNGVILFHDTAVRERGFGVHRLWAEVSEGRPAFHFEHSHGLGVLGVGDAIPADVSRFFEEGRRRPAALRALFASLGAAIERRVEAEGAKMIEESRRSLGIIRRTARALRHRWTIAHNAR